MMSGLRSQREYTITCVSLKAGMASSGRLWRAHQPVTAAAATRRKTSKRLRAENSMTVLIMIGSRRHRGSQLAFGIDEKVAGRHDALAGLQAAADFNTAVGLLTDLDAARLKKAVAAIDVHHLLLARIEH